MKLEKGFFLMNLALFENVTISCAKHGAKPSHFKKACGALFAVLVGKLLYHVKMEASFRGEGMGA